jgi:hypothetical protein
VKSGKYGDFWSKVSMTGNICECWIWNGAMSSLGYGGAYRGNKTGKAYRVAFEITFGAVPTGLELDHLCRVPACVNPWHLEPVTHAENVRRGDSGRVNGARQRAKTHCPSGHEYNEENTRVYSGKRYCKQCAERRTRETRAAQKSKGATQ